MVVQDAGGAVIGVISQIGRGGDGGQVAVIDIDGAHVPVPASSLSPGPGANQARLNQTKAPLLAAGFRPG